MLYRSSYFLYQTSNNNDIGGVLYDTGCFIIRMTLYYALNICSTDNGILTHLAPHIGLSHWLGLTFPSYNVWSLQHSHIHVHTGILISRTSI